MTDYLGIIEGKVHDMYHRFEYPISELRLVSAENSKKAHEMLEAAKNELERKLHCPDIILSKFGEVQYLECRPIAIL